MADEDGATRPDGRPRVEVLALPPGRELRTETEKWIVRRAFFVYGWLRAAFRYTARFPIEHPVLAAAMNRIGNEGWEELQYALEREIGFRGGPVTKISETGT